jgi:hypothetical protein
VLERLFPRSLEQGYQGHPVAKWVLVLLTLVTLWRSLVHIFYTDGGAQSIATIPLDTFTANGAAAVVLIFAMWGLSQLLMGGVYALVLWRYQALIPAVWLLFVAEWGGRLGIGLLKPAIETAERPPGAVGNVVFPVLGLAMLALALRKGRDDAAPLREAAPAR